MDNYWNDNDHEATNAEGQLQDYQFDGKLQRADRICFSFASLYSQYTIPGDHTKQAGCL